VDTALKMALAYHRARGEAGRVRFIGRERGYHGVGFGGISVGGITPNRKAFASATLPFVDHISHTHSLKDMAFSRGLPTWGLHLAEELERLVLLHDASTIAAVIIEPVAGSTGVLPPPEGYVKRIRDICTKYGILLIFDEVITGFGRVKAYRFDADGNGQVLAEVADPGYPRYLGLCFPASDIPRQARELYRVNRIRVIEDANYQAVPLVPAANPRTGKPLDMSFAALRSVSPVHLQYMRNMGTLASMSLSIVVDGQLWGLVSCHHEQPRPVDLRTRTACELLASVLSLQIESREAHANTRKLLDLRQHTLGCRRTRGIVVHLDDAGHSRLAASGILPARETVPLHAQSLSAGI
jgi:hypothetical protein